MCSSLLSKLIPKKVRLSIPGKTDEIQCCYASKGLIAIVSGLLYLIKYYFLSNDFYSYKEFFKQYINE